MRYLTVAEVLSLHRLLIEQTGGSTGIRDLGALQSAVAQPQMTFGGDDLYPSLQGKAAPLCFSLVANHPFLDGNKRVAHAAMETFLMLNGSELSATVDEQERVMLSLAAGQTSRDELVAWLRSRVVRSSGGTG
jgi:death-on-curing protein